MFKIKKSFSNITLSLDNELFWTKCPVSQVNYCFFVFFWASNKKETDKLLRILLLFLFLLIRLKIICFKLFGFLDWFILIIGVASQLGIKQNQHHLRKESTSKSSNLKGESSSKIRYEEREAYTWARRHCRVKIQCPRSWIIVWLQCGEGETR